MCLYSNFHNQLGIDHRAFASVTHGPSSIAHILKTLGENEPTLSFKMNPNWFNTVLTSHCLAAVLGSVTNISFHQVKELLETFPGASGQDNSFFRPKELKHAAFLVEVETDF